MVTAAMALRVWPEETLSPEVAQRRLREAIFAVVEPSLEGSLQRALDVGCSVGVGTLALRDWLDQRGDRHKRIAAWHHAAAEAKGLPAGRFDLITLQFVCHELPQSATLTVSPPAIPAIGWWWRSPPPDRARLRTELDVCVCVPDLPPSAMQVWRRPNQGLGVQPTPTVPFPFSS